MCENDKKQKKSWEGEEELKFYIFYVYNKPVIDKIKEKDSKARLINFYDKIVDYILKDGPLLSKEEKGKIRRDYTSHLHRAKDKILSLKIDLDSLSLNRSDEFMVPTGEDEAKLRKILSEVVKAKFLQPVGVGDINMLFDESIDWNLHTWKNYKGLLQLRRLLKLFKAQYERNLTNKITLSPLPPVKIEEVSASAQHSEERRSFKRYETRVSSHSQTNLYSQDTRANLDLETYSFGCTAEEFSMSQARYYRDPDAMAVQTFPSPYKNFQLSFVKMEASPDPVRHKSPQERIEDLLRGFNEKDWGHGNIRVLSDIIKLYESVEDTNQSVSTKIYEIIISGLEHFKQMLCLPNFAKFFRENGREIKYHFKQFEAEAAVKRNSNLLNVESCSNKRRDCSFERLFKPSLSEQICLAQKETIRAFASDDIFYGDSD